MKPYSLRKRAAFYHRAFPKWPPLRSDARWLDGMWVMGNNYRGSGYYGAYPPNYLERVMALFPDAEAVLHLFSGSLPQGDYLRFDIQGNPEVVGDAHRLSSYICQRFDLVLADPPYSNEDAAHYGNPLVNRNTVLRECGKVLLPGGFVVWLDQVLPMFRKDTLHLCGLVGIVRSTNHRFRIASIFKRLP
ncbi:hypothetical protein LCGC14_1358800 [marine sediment metagenome]|uniref:DNA methylase N-4/N-6 domain-containing protein n=1 Tax=marine sediment metagenome TaxID=412755 RepID=A0A0F9K9B4_9ZZZZ